MNYLRKIILSDNSGFTLIEIIIVIVMISIMTMLAAPKMSTFFGGNERVNFALATGLIAKTFDDSFLNDRTNYLTIHLYEGDEVSEEDSDKNEIFSRHNAISVMNLVDGKFVDSSKKILRHREFPESFKLEEIVLSSGEKIANGNVLIPFYPQGYSDNIILHILVDDEEKWSIRIFKHLKEPEVIPEYVNFEGV